MKDTFKIYYTGVLKRLKAEIDLLNDIIPHALTKGQNNEESLKNVIKNLIPSKYSIGSGIIIDSFGERSRQCDIIIYDNTTYPNLFNQSSNSIFPVETVIACIEIKTYIDDEILNDVTLNTESLRKLKHYVPEITLNQPDPQYPIAIKKFPTRPPLSFLVCFRSNSNNPDTWKKRFLAKNFSNLPDISFLIDNAAMYFFKDIAKTRDALNFMSIFFLLREFDINPSGGKKQFYYSDKPNHEFLINGNIYRSTSLMMDKEYPIPMPERAFLSFLIELIRQLDTYPRHITFDATKYLDDQFIDGTIIP